MKRHALFVGVDNYADGHIPNLACAVNDATDLHGFFKFGAGYDKVELLPNPAEKKKILGKVRSLTADLGPGDFFLFFFAGHGFRVGENHVLVCSDDLYDDVKHEHDGLPLGQLKRRLSGAFDSAILLDACQSDILATRGGEGISERDLSAIHVAPAEKSGCGALTIVTSCDAGQAAAELSEKQHGLFTEALLELLEESKKACSRVDLSDAFRLSLGRRMGEIAARFRLPTEQRPRFSCTGDSCFVLLDDSDSAPVPPDPPPQPPSPPPSPRRRIGVGIFALLAALCAGSWWLAKSSAPVVPPPPVKAELDAGANAEATEIRVEAVVHKSKVERIPDDDGFRIRKDELAKMFARADALFDERVGRWSDAAQQFTNFVNRCEALVKLDGERSLASMKRNEAESARNRAREAEAEKFASACWQQAEKSISTASSEFRQMKFGTACSAFDMASKQFSQCVDEAKVERERQEAAAAEKARREAEEKARLAAERKAEAERKAREAAEREEALRNGTCRETGICRTITLPGGAKIEMIYCAPGEFMMGSPESEDGRNGKPQHRVTLTKGFWLGKYEVTQEQWQSVMGDHPSEFEGDRNPVENISWEDCQKFIQKINSRLNCGARLPTEAEWEYACRAGTTTAYFWGNALNGDKANCDGSYPCGTMKKGPYLEKTTPVGRYGANAWGFADMHGNVCEWCNDWYGRDYYRNSHLVDPQGPTAGDLRVLRGGSWDSLARRCRSANRSGNSPGNRDSRCGFRLCCSAGPREGAEQSASAGNAAQAERAASGARARGDTSTGHQMSEGRKWDIFR